jgi:EAL domain-containing protein (putative c-di-GMP-specific phosphodiesterase class I)
VLELTSGTPIAVDAVPHWLHPSRGLLPAAEWMPVLEQSDLVGSYLLWLLDEALTAHRGWYGSACPHRSPSASPARRCPAPSPPPWRAPESPPAN